LRGSEILKLEKIAEGCVWCEMTKRDDRKQK